MIHSLYFQGFGFIPEHELYSPTSQKWVHWLMLNCCGCVYMGPGDGLAHSGCLHHPRCFQAKLWMHGDPDQHKAVG